MTETKAVRLSSEIKATKKPDQEDPAEFDWSSQ
jgi:hypothetical protein